MKKKKMLSTLLALILSISMSMTAFATDLPDTAEESDKQEATVTDDTSLDSEESNGSEQGKKEVESDEESKSIEPKGKIESDVQTSEEAENITISETNFPDKSFRNYVTNTFDKDSDGVLSIEEIKAVTEINFEWGEVTVADLTGLQYFENLETFNCACALDGIRTLDFSDNVSLKILDCSYNADLTSVNVSRCKGLEELYCYESGITVMDVSNNTKLIRLDCNNTSVSSLDVTKCQELFALNCENTLVSSLDLSKNPKLYEVYITNDDSFTELDISKNPELVHLRIGGTSLTEIDTSHNPKLAALYMENTNIKSIDLSKNPEMFEIFCHDSKLEALDVSGLKQLRSLECYNTSIKKIDVSQSKSLTGLQIYNTQISELDIKNNVNLVRLEVQNTLIKKLDISNCKALEYLDITNTSISNLKELDVSGYKKLDELYCANAGIEKLTIGTLSLSGLCCEGNAIAGLDLSKLGEDNEDYWGPYLGITASPQEKNVSCTVDQKTGTQIVDLKNLVPDISKVTMQEGEGYTYDNETGIITLNKSADAVISYTYNHGCVDLELPISVTLKVHYHSDIVNDKALKASFIQNGKTAGTHCSVCGAVIEAQSMISKVTATLSASSHVYNGKKKIPSVVVKSGNKVLKNGVDYTVGYVPGFKKIGQYNVTITLKGEEYAGNTILVYRVVPKSTKISKVKKAKKGLTVTWKKQTKQTNGYEIQCSLKKDFSSNVKKKLVKKNKITSVKFKKLKAKKTYYVRVRTYKTVKVNGKSKKIYSKWSSIKKCKTR